MTTKKCISCLSLNTKNLGFIDFGNSAYSSQSKLFNCLSCGIFWVSPIPKEKELSKIYSGVYHYHPNKIKDFLLSLYFSLELVSDYKLIEKYKKGGRVLDIGAGRGDFLLKFPRNKWEWWAHDPYLSKFETNFLKDKVGTYVNNFKELKFYPSGNFDVVVLRNVIEHTAGFSRLIKESKRLLRKKGIIFIRTPNMDSLDFKIFKNNWYEVRMGGHVVFFGKIAMRKILKKEGFKVRFNKGMAMSYPLSLFRSSKINLPSPIVFILSLGFSSFSGLFGDGGDLRAIAQK